MSTMTPALEQWTVYSAAQNLPAVLNDPNRGKQSNFFVKTWGDGFVDKSDIGKSPFLPEVNRSHFELYLRKHGKRHKRHARLSHSRLPVDGESCLNGPPTGNVTSGPGAKTQRNNVPSTASKDVNDLSAVPEMFLRPSLALNDAGTFNAVFPCVVGGIAHNQRDDRIQQSGRLLQEKLSHYLDVVEVHIARQVSHKSSAFFHAMTSHDTIMEQMGGACREVKRLRSEIQGVDATLAVGPLRLLGLARSRSNHAALLDKLRLMSTVLQTQPTLQLLLSSSDYVAALELIAGTQDVLARELAGVTSLRHLPSQLKEMSRLIDKMLRTEFQRYAEADLHRPLETTDGVVEPERLVSLVAGLLRQNNLQFLEVYKKEAMTAAHAALKQLVIEQMAECEGDTHVTGQGDVSLAGLDPVRWLRLLVLSADALAKLIRRVKDTHDVVRDTADFSAGRCPVGEESVEVGDSFLSATDHRCVEDKLQDLLTSVCDHFHDRLATVVSAQNGAAMTPTQITELSRIVERFTVLCGQVSGQQQSVSLRVSFNIQAGRYVARFHQQRKAKLLLLLEAEQWRAAEVPVGFQRLVDGLARGSKITTSAEGDGDVPDIGQLVVPDSPIVAARDKEETSDCLRVGQQKFVTVGAVLMLLRLVSEYCACAEELPSQALYVGRNLADILKTFNSRTCQLVLGAQALKVTGLKTITSTNLALAGRALQLVQWLIPHVAAHFRRLVGEDVPTMDAVRTEIGRHVQDVEAKILGIMSTLLGDQLTQWNARPPVPSNAFRNISRHLSKLHEAVSTVLPLEQVSGLYVLVHKNFKECLRDQITRMNIVNNGGPQHGVVTSELTFYLETMRTLKVLPAEELSGKAMEEIWTKKP